GGRPSGARRGGGAGRAGAARRGRRRARLEQLVPQRPAAGGPPRGAAPRRAARRRPAPVGQRQLSLRVRSSRGIKRRMSIGIDMLCEIHVRKGLTPAAADVDNLVSETLPVVGRACVDISEIRVKLVDQTQERLKAFCTVTINREFVIRDVKVIEGPRGPFVA